MGEMIAEVIEKFGPTKILDFFLATPVGCVRFCMVLLMLAVSILIAIPASIFCSGHTRARINFWLEDRLDAAMGYQQAKPANQDFGN